MVLTDQLSRQQQTRCVRKHVSGSSVTSPTLAKVKPEQCPCQWQAMQQQQGLCVNWVIFCAVGTVTALQLGTRSAAHDWAGKWRGDTLPLE
ncbi:MAG TPA: hypothetical protein VGV14_03800 [Rhodanobacter sp.]|nr:hypothetical protein [Rhodanobacter sp.]